MVGVQVRIRVFLSICAFFALPALAGPTPDDTAAGEPAKVDGGENVSIAPGEPLVVTSNPKFFQALKEGILRRGKAFSSVDRNQILLQLTAHEVLMNVYRHAHRDAPNKRIWITMWEERDVFYLRVQDEGGNFFNPFDPNEPRNRFRFLEDEVESTDERMDEIENLRIAANHDPSRPDGGGGRGIQLLSRMMHSLVYEPHFIDGETVGTSVTVGFSKKAEVDEPCPKTVARKGWLRVLSEILSVSNR